MTFTAQFDTSENLSTSSVTQNHHTMLAKSGDCLQFQQGDFLPWDNPDNIISQQTMVWITLAISLGGIPLLWVVGTVGNVLSGTVFYRQGLSSRINLCLFSLALADLISVTVLFLLHAEVANRILVGPTHIFITYFLGFTGFALISQLLSTVIAFERCVCVVSPLKARHMMSTRKMSVFIGVSSAVLLGGLLVTRGTKFTMACVTDSLTNVSSEIVFVTSFYLSYQKIIAVFDIIVYSMAIPFIFLTIIVVTTIITASKLRSAIKWRHQSVDAFTRETSVSGSDGPSGTSITDQKPKTQEVATMPLKEVSLTRMLMATSLMFVVYQMPCQAILIAIYLVQDLHMNGRYYNLIAILQGLVSFCWALNSSLNVFVYHAMGSRFRETLREILSCCIKR